MKTAVRLYTCPVIVLVWMVASGCGGNGVTTGIDLTPEPEVSGDVTAEVGSPDTDIGREFDAVGCLSDLNCKYLEDQAGPCEVPVCEDGICTLGAGMDGIMCDDGDPCTLWDLCEGGECAPGEPKDCDDGEVCTADFCQSDTGNCIYAFLDGDACDDGTACTVDDVCAGGTCGGAAIECLDDDPCTADGCDAETGCVFPVMDDGAVCDDGNPCTAGDACLDGICGSSGLTSCNDGNTCTADGCDILLGCVNNPLTGDPCDDGNSCTAGDECVDGVCEGGENTCLCATDEDCEAFEDGDLCNGTLLCVDEQCVLDADTVVECAPSTNSCVVIACDSDTGGCVETQLEDGLPCDDGDLCTEGDACIEGACEGGMPLFCDDDDPCTGDECDPALGCTLAPLSGVPCQDGDPCTGGDLCEDGECVAGESICDCEEHADCAEFDDGNPCTGTYICVDNACQVDPGTVVLCAELIFSVCMKNQCDPATGQCAMTAQPDETPCDDGDVCTEYDACTGGECGGVAVLCDDGNPCTDNVCDPSAGGCVALNNNTACDDGDVCTEDDLCVAGACQGTQISCDDGNSCTFDLCDGEAGCTNTVKVGPCDDGDVCTLTDICVEGICQGSDLQDCDDGNACTADTCDPADGCQTKLEDGPCDDGDACTEGDWCVDGACQEGQPVFCDDGNPCTADSCDSLSGCQNELLDGVTCDTGDPCLADGVCVDGECVVETTACEDGDACTTGDVCLDGVCVGGPPPDCDDDLVCTQDSCESDTGCINDPAPLDGVSCDDGDACSLGDVCGDGTCAGVEVLDCDDDNDCTDDACDPELGCVYSQVMVACDDGDPCTEQDACVEGICVGAPKDCGDEDPCTQDLCDSTQGCFHPPVPDEDQVPCDDGDLCTVTDVCAGGECLGQDPVDCDDDEVCTDDFCDPSTGDCVHQDNDDACDDGNPCTQGDVCAGGECQPGASSCQCVTTAECAGEEDGDYCNGTLICVGYECVVDPGTVVDCDDSGDTDCTTNTCLPDTGTCVMVESDCQQDDNTCTLDVCDPTQGCVTTFVTGACDDGDVCTEDDACSGGECTGQPYDCDDDNVCTDDFCFVQEGAPQCFHQNASGVCDDGSVCTVGDVCSGGTCVGDTISCDDDNICTDDSCDPEEGCQHVPNTTLCDDGDLCTHSDVCSDGVCAGTDKDCDDANVCTDDACDFYTGDCVYDFNSAPCDDDDVCTVNDACEYGVCVGDELDCDDDDQCTEDYCEAGVGCKNDVTPGEPCDDGDICTDDDLCDTSGDCAGDAIPGCCQGNADCFTGYQCNEGVCVNNWCVYEVMDCSDGNDCTADVCTNGSCDHVPFGEDGAEVYHEGFDGEDAHGWTTWIGDEASTDEVYWSVSSNRSSSAPNSLYGGNPDALSYDFGTVDAWAASPWFLLPDGVFIGIKLRYWADFEEDDYQYDWLDVYVEAQGQEPALVGERIHASTLYSWKDWSVFGYELAPFCGKEVRILLRFATGDAVKNAGEGVYVDEVRVVAGEKQGCCEFDSDCFDTDLCTEDLCGETWSCVTDDVFGSYLWEIFPNKDMPQGWTWTSTNPQLFWSVQSFRSVSTRYAFYGGNPETQTYDHGAGSFAAVSPQIDLKNAVAPVLRFNLFAHFDDTSCAADVFQAILVIEGDFPVQVTIYTDCNGTGGDFDQVEVDLSDHVGSVVQVRFYVAVDDVNNSGEGVYVDDVRVDEEGVQDPGCCEGDSGCFDGDQCTDDICVGEPGAGVCLNPPLPVVEDDFDDGDSEGWVITSGDQGMVAWFVSDEDAVSQDYSLQASTASAPGSLSSGWTTAFSPPILVDSASDDVTLVLEYFRTLVDGSEGGAAVSSLEVRWQYRLNEGGFWQQGVVLDYINAPTQWDMKVFTINPGPTVFQVRIRFKFSYTCNAGDACNSRANIDNFRLGWEGCM